MCGMHASTFEDHTLRQALSKRHTLENIMKHLLQVSPHYKYSVLMGSDMSGQPLCVMKTINHHVNPCDLIWSHVISCDLVCHACVYWYWFCTSL